MTLLPNEVVIPTKVDGVTLTNLRLRYEPKGEFHSMFLTEVSSIHYKNVSNWLWLVVGALFVILGSMAFVNSGDIEGAYIAIGGFALIGIYFKTRRTEVKIVSRGGGSLELAASNKFNAISALFDQIEDARFAAENAVADFEGLGDIL